MVLLLHEKTHTMQHHKGLRQDYFPDSLQVLSSSSPPLRVIAARMEYSDTPRRSIGRLEPSAKATTHIGLRVVISEKMKVSGKAPPSGGSGPAGSYSISAGLVQGTASPPSAIRIVLDVPSGKSLGMRGPSLISNGVPLPTNT